MYTIVRYRRNLQVTWAELIVVPKSSS